MLVMKELLGQYSFIFSLNPFVLANDVPLVVEKACSSENLNFFVIVGNTNFFHLVLFFYSFFIPFYLSQELLELGETVGTESRGLSQEQISSIPVSKYKCGRFFFFRKKSREERLFSVSRFCFSFFKKKFTSCKFFY